MQADACVTLCASGKVQSMQTFIIITVAVAVGLILLLWRKHRIRDARRAKLLKKPMLPEWREIMQRNVPLYERLPPDRRYELEGLVNVFLAEKTFEGCGGQQIDDEVRVTIAGQACMLLLGRKTRFYPRLRTILVYPTAYFDQKKLTGDGLRQGESWQNGPVVLAWNSTLGGAQNMHDGQNVVFHEFAHQLDQEDCIADGAPVLAKKSCYGSWARVLSEEYDALRGKAKKRQRSVLRKYGAAHPAEFFAVATEAFIEKPRQMQKRHPELYEELRNYYTIDPVSWT